MHVTYKRRPPFADWHNWRDCTNGRHDAHSSSYGDEQENSLMVKTRFILSDQKWGCNAVQKSTIANDKQGYLAHNN
jgi:hypothetical protein